LMRTDGGGLQTPAALLLRASDDACERGDVAGVIPEELTVSKAEVDEHVTKMRSLYNGYCFSPRQGARLVFNPTMVASYLKALSKDGDVLDFENHRVMIELPPAAQQLLSKRRGAPDLLRRLAADVIEELPEAKLTSQMSPEKLRDQGSIEVTHMLFLQFGAATLMHRETDSALVLRVPNSNVKRAIVDLLLHSE
jgi:hypothetical protein